MNRLSKIFGAVVFVATFCSATQVLQDLDYTDAMQTLANYDRGFYEPVGLHLKPNGGEPLSNAPGHLVHLRTDISEFSSNAKLSDTEYGKSQDLTEDALNVLQQSLDVIRKANAKVILRICYDPWYKGNSNVTPEHGWVLRHVKQLAPVLSKNTDVIIALEMGMHGAYGEMHSDTAITYPRVAEAVNTMLKNTPPELKILTRTANYSAAVLGFENWAVDFRVDGDVFKKIAQAKGDTMYRVGMFNDGYLGTEYDYGTWGVDCAKSICREEGVAWLEKYSIHTPYGGEALATASGYKVVNTPEYLAYEGFRTHTSYLNLRWNDRLIDSWKKSHFNRTDYEYDGQKIDSLTGFKYINDHLGYRFVLRESWLPDTVFANENLKGKLKIQNVGFGNLTHKAAAKILFVRTPPQCTGTSLCPDTAITSLLDTASLTNVDFQNVLSRTIAVNGNDTTVTFDGVNEIALDAKVPQSNENYDVYLLVDDVQFANEFVNKGFGYTLNENALYLGHFYASTKNASAAIQKGKVQKTKQKTPSVVHSENGIRVRVNDKNYRVNGKAF